MSFAAAMFVLILIYVRPQEWSTIAFRLKPIHLSVLFGIVAFLNQKVYRFELKTFLRTPHDWAMVAFFAYIVYADFLPFMETFDMVRVFVIWYFIIVLGLRTVQDLMKFLMAWGLLICLVCAVAIQSLYLYDFQGSRYLTESIMQGRLALNLSIFNNANALGHASIMAFPLLYFSFWWKNNLRRKLMFIALASIPAVAIYMTQSRGAAVAGISLICVAFIFGRPIWVQMILLCLALSMAPAALSKMPRMDSSDAISKDQGVVGRLLAFEWGREAMARNKYGVGFYQFTQSFERDNGFPKDAHSTYVLVGAEIGYWGLVLLIALLYTCFRSTFWVRTQTFDEERCRRALFSCLTAYLLSSWMINIAYSPFVILIVACCGAFERIQRQVYVDTKKARETVQANAVLARRQADGHVLPGNALAMDQADPEALTVPSTPMPERAIGSTARAKAGMSTDYRDLPKIFGSKWKRFGIIDIIMIAIGTRVVVELWEYIIAQYLVSR